MGQMVQFLRNGQKSKSTRFLWHASEFIPFWDMVIKANNISKPHTGKMCLWVHADSDGPDQTDQGLCCSHIPEDTFLLAKLFCVWNYRSWQVCLMNLFKSIFNDTSTLGVILCRFYQRKKKKTKGLRWKERKIEAEEKKRKAVQKKKKC